jgi:hypothetical protein
MATQASHKARILVLSAPDAPELSVLERLPQGATVLGVGRTLEDLQKSTRAWRHSLACTYRIEHVPACAGMQLLAE